VGKEQTKKRTSGGPKTPKYITNDVQLLEQSLSAPKQENNRQKESVAERGSGCPGGESELTHFLQSFSSFSSSSPHASQAAHAPILLR
jgi:hypothetical protein